MTKVLWFTNIPMPEACAHQGTVVAGSGTWMIALLEALARVQDIKVGVVTAYRGFSDAHFSKGGVDYFTLNLPREPRYQTLDESRALLRCVDIVRGWQPHLVHIHGTERFYGLLIARGLVKVPALVTIQGLLHAIAPKAWGSLCYTDILRTVSVREFLLGSGTIWSAIRRRQQAEMGVEIICGCKCFAGQTLWDESHVWALNRDAHYWRVGRLLRAPFYTHRWEIGKCERNTILFTNCTSPLRDVESLIEAVAMLRREFPEIRLHLAGALNQRSAYGRFLARRLQRLSGSFDMLGYLKAEDLAGQLARAHVFAIASHIENESNSLCEAMLVGVPCVVSFAGGMPTMACPEHSGLFFPMGEAAYLARQIRRILLDDRMASALGRAGHMAAAERHELRTVVEQQLAAYRAVIACAY